MKFDLKNAETEFKKSEEWLRSEFLQIHTGMATPALLDGIQAESYGTMQPLKNMASINIEDPKTLRIAPWDKSVVKSIEKAIIDSNLGLGVATDSDGIRLSFPPLTTERRSQMVKILKDLQEEARIRVRKIREAQLKIIAEIEKEGSMSEDEKHNAQDEVQKLVTNANLNLESIFKKKESDVMGK